MSDIRGELRGLKIGIETLAIMTVIYLQFMVQLVVPGSLYKVLVSFTHLLNEKP